MADIKIGKYLGKYVYVDEDKLNEIAKKYPDSYLHLLECVAEMIRHPREKRPEGTEGLVFESPFGMVGITLKHDKWYLEWAGFYSLYSI